MFINGTPVNCTWEITSDPKLFPSYPNVSACGRCTAYTGAASTSYMASGSQEPGPWSGPEDTHAVPDKVNTYMYVSKNETLKTDIMWSLKVTSKMERTA